MSFRAVAAVLLVAGCGAPPFVERSTQVVLAPDGSDFWDRPMPSDLRREADGSFDIEKWPMSRESDLLLDWFGAANERLRGWGVSSGIFQPMTGAVDPASLPATPAASMEASSSVFLVDVDPDSPERGRRFPLEVQQITEGDKYTPDNLLAAVPVFGFIRRPMTEYALVVTTDVLDVEGAPVGRSPDFHQAFEGHHDDDAVDAHFERLRELLEEEGFDTERVAGAAVFETMDHESRLLSLVEWAEANVQPALTSDWTEVEVFDDYRVLEATYELPVIQSGRRPYTGRNEGRILFDTNGDPEIQEWQEVRLVLALPNSEKPADGWPLMLYLHGSGGNAYQHIERGPTEELPRDMRDPPVRGTGPAMWLARRGVASLGIDFPLHGTRHSPPDTTGLILYNLFGNISATIDNFTVSVMELTILSRLVLDLEPGFDPNRLTAMGQSMGTTLGMVWATVDPRLKGIVLSGAGGILVEIAVEAVEPVMLKGIAELALRLDEEEEVHLAHPVLHAAQNLWDLVDPIAKANRLVKAPFDGVPPKHVMMTAGFLDGYFNPRSQAAMAVAMGLPLAGERVEPILGERIDLAGNGSADFPLSHNLSGMTAGVVQYAAPHTLGHYVVFNQPGARHQYTCFVKSIGTGSEAIPPPADDETPCP